ncbi:MAG: DUF1501 domain-containing protein [Saprospirales bacterium]|nr:DUF1501 domain-containing protein [Saprospirales bacterium]
MKRRDFIKTSTAVSLPLLLNGFGVRALGRNSLFNAFNGDTDKVLVLIQLNGGNDGLNMILPLDQYSKLANARPNILIPENSALLLSPETGLHPVMTGLKSVYDNARMTVVQGAGYPNQNRSHFRSTDIWTSGSPAEQTWNTGWLGRYLDVDHVGFPDNYPNPDYPDPFAITIGSLVSSTCQGVGANYSLAITDPFNLYPLASGGEDTAPNTPYGDELTFMRQSILQTNEYSDVITDAANLGSNLANYPADNGLAQQLKNVALLIKGGLKTRIYVASLGGFDTHANQVENDGDTTIGEHADLLKTLSDAVAAFQEDLQLLGLEERVLTMTFSEFGRRIQSNDSFGTDHGSAAPLLIFGSCINPGLLGDNPDIPDPIGDQDGVALQYDFRDIYGSVLMDWFGVPQDSILDLLHPEFQYIPVIQPCSPSGSSDLVAQPEEVDLFVYPNPFQSQVSIRFTSSHERVRLSVFDSLSCEREVLFDKVLPAGQHEVPFNGSRLAPGTYYVRVQLENGRQKSRTLVKI